MSNTERVHQMGVESGTYTGVIGVTYGKKVDHMGLGTNPPKYKWFSMMASGPRPNPDQNGRHRDAFIPPNWKKLQHSQIETGVAIDGTRLRVSQET